MYRLLFNPIQYKQTTFIKMVFSCLLLWIYESTYHKVSIENIPEQLIFILPFTGDRDTGPPSPVFSTSRLKLGIRIDTQVAFRS